MATVEFIRAKNIRIYKDGNYIGSATNLDMSAEQEIITRQYIGDDTEVSIAGIKTFGGTLTRDMTDEEFLESIIGRVISTKFDATNYTDTPDVSRGTIDNVTNVDISFTTPTDASLTLQSVSLNLLKTGSFSGGLDIEVWEGLAGTGTLKTTLNIPASDIPTTDNDFITAYKHPEASETALTSNTAHTLRLTAGGAPTGSVDAYGVTAVVGDPYFSIAYETTTVADADYTLDIVLSKEDGTEVAVLRDTGVVFLSNGVNANSGEPITEASGWKAKKREIL